jgi:hypothetical protein
MKISKDKCLELKRIIAACLVVSNSKSLTSSSIAALGLRREAERHMVKILTVTETEKYHMAFCTEGLREDDYIGVTLGRARGEVPRCSSCCFLSMCMSAVPARVHRLWEMGSLKAHGPQSSPALVTLDTGGRSYRQWPHMNMVTEPTREHGRPCLLHPLGSEHRLLWRSQCLSSHQGLGLTYYSPYERWSQRRRCRLP